jgi:hypothetical protein
MASPYNGVTMKTFLFVTSLLLANALLYAPSFGSFGGIGGGATVQGICPQPEGVDGVDKAHLLEALKRAAALKGEEPPPTPGDPIPAPPTPIPPVPDPGCANCKLAQDPIDDSYCMSKGTDCDNIFGPNESYLYERRKYLYRCPDGKHYVRCSGWGRTKCCSGGSAAPKPLCVHKGHYQCP